MKLELPPGIYLEQILPDGHIGAFSSLALVDLQLIAFGLIALAAVVAMIRWGRRARAAERSFRPDEPIAPGERVIHGTVEYARSEEKAVRVEVDQRGTESESSGSWSTSWTEYNRRLQVRPFYIKLASGQRVRVEPDHEVELVDAMDGVIRVNLAQRVRVAELTPDEQVFAHGRLEHDTDPEAATGYRGGALGLVLRPPSSGRMLLSTEPLGARFRRRARLYRRFLYGLVALCLIPDLFLTSYFLSLAAGQPGRATVTDLKHTVETGDDGDVHHYLVHLQVTEPERRSFVEEVEHSLFVKLKAGMVLPVRMTMLGDRTTRLGPRATYHAASVFLLFGPLFILALVYVVVAGRPIAWYEGDFDEGESGRLRESKPPPPDEPPAPE